MISLVFRTDVHLADKSPASWKASYLDEVLSNLRQVAKIAKDFDAHAVLDGGDLFHVKSPHRNSHALVGECIRLHTREYSCPVFTVVGNHDVQYNQRSSLPNQPLGVVLASGAVTELTSQVFESKGVRVRVVGVPFEPDRTLESLKAIQKQPGDDYLIAVVHALAALEPPKVAEEFFGEPIFRYNDLVSENGPDVFCFGHWHKDQGVTYLGSKAFVNPGALSRGSLSFETLQRTPKAVVLTLDSEIRIQEIPLEVAPASEVFNQEAKAQKERDTKRIQAYLEQLRLNLDSGPRSVSITDTLNHLGLSERVRLEIGKYLEAAGYDASDFLLAVQEDTRPQPFP